MKEFLESLLALLNDPDENIVTHALHTLRKHPSDAVVERIRTVLPSLSPRGIGVAVGTLGILSRGHEEDLLLSLLEAPSAIVRFEACRQLGQSLTGARAPLLAQALAREADPRCKAVMLSMVARGPLPVDPSAVRPHLEDPDARVRASAVEALSAITSGTPPEGIAGLVDDSSPRVRAAALRALFPEPTDELADRVREELGSGELGRVLAALHLLGTLPLMPWTAPELVRHLSADEEAVRLLAARSLARLGAALDVDTIVALYLGEHSSAVREQIERVLGRQDPGAVVGRLGAAIGRADARRQATAVRGLGELGDGRAVPHLMRALRQPDPRVRANAVEALARLRPPDLADMLRPLLDDPAGRVTTNVAVALYRLGHRDVLDSLFRMLRHRDVARKSCAAFALGEIGTTEVEGPLTELLETLAESVVLSQAERQLQRHVLRALKKIRTL